MKSRVQKFSIGATLAAAATALAGAIAAPAAYADTIDELLMQSEGDFTQAATLYAGIDPSLLSAHDAAHQAGEVTGLDNQAGLLSTLQANQDTLPESVQTSTQLLAADQQLATASNEVLAAFTTYTNAADAGDYAGGPTATLAGEVAGYFDRLDLAYTELFQFLPAEFNAAFTTEFATYPILIEPFNPPATDLAPASSAAVEPTSLLSEATTNYTDADHVLAQIPMVGDASTAGLLTQNNLDLQDIAQLGTSETALNSYDNGVLAELLNPLFNSVNQGWDQASEAVLTADQALQTAAGTGSDTAIDSAIYSVLGAQLESPTFSSAFIDIGAHFLTGIDPFSAGADTVSAADPGIVADLLSSIGF